MKRSEFKSEARVDGEEVAVSFLDGGDAHPYSVTIPDAPDSTVGACLTRAQAVSLYQQLQTAFRHDPSLHQGSIP